MLRGAQRGGERGTVLLLMPVAVLILVVLGAICVDFAAVFLAQRELANAAAGAANDAATRALDLQRFYGRQETALDPGLAQQVASAAVAAERLELLGTPVATAAVDGASVTVTVSGEVATVFARAVRGGPQRIALSATARATADRR